MTAVEIIEEIKRLPEVEKIRIIDFVRTESTPQALSPEELGNLAQRMVDANDPAVADRFQAEIVRGFYGKKADA